MGSGQSGRAGGKVLALSSSQKYFNISRLVFGTPGKHWTVSEAWERYSGHDEDDDDMMIVQVFTKKQGGRELRDYRKWLEACSRFTHWNNDQAELRGGES